MWQALFKDRLKAEVPIIHITNGVHNSWISSKIQYLLKRYVSPDFIHYLANNNDAKDPWRKIMNIPDEEVWEAHNVRKLEMIRFVRRKLVAELIEKGYSSVRIKRISKMLNHNYLTIAFARRFVAYKRASLILKDKNRLKELLSNQERPIQIIFAGKAHPADMTGKNIIKEIIDFAKEYDLRDRVLFLEDYDMEIAHYLVQGVDLWLNNPIKPVEASGTSGMKAGMNGILNMSVRDGWWDESYNGRNGWAITAGEAYEIPELRDLADANQLYNLLEEISSLYYDRESDDVPHNWVKMMKASMYSVTKNFNISRMLDEYALKFYVPAAGNANALLANKGAALDDHIEKLAALRRVWEQLYIKELYTDFDKKTQVFTEDKIKLECYVHIGDIDINLINVEIFYMMEKTNDYEIVDLTFVEKYADHVAKYVGEILVKHSGVQSFNARIVPRDEMIRQLYPEFIKWMG
jgi:starch phosphorylase